MKIRWQLTRGTAPGPRLCPQDQPQRLRRPRRGAVPKGIRSPCARCGWSPTQPRSARAPCAANQLHLLDTQWDDEPFVLVLERRTIFLRVAKKVSLLTSAATRG